MYNIIYTQDCTPDALRSGSPECDYYEVTTSPPRTNMSGDIRFVGWLGETNGINQTACGEYATRASAHEWLRSQGQIPLAECNESLQRTHEDAEDDLWFSAECALAEIADAEEWLSVCLDDLHAEIAAGADVEEIEERLVAEALANGYRFRHLDLAELLES